MTLLKFCDEVQKKDNKKSILLYQMGYATAPVCLAQLHDPLHQLVEQVKSGTLSDKIIREQLMTIINVNPDRLFREFIQFCKDPDNIAKLSAVGLTFPIDDTKEAELLELAESIWKLKGE